MVAKMIVLGLIAVVCFILILTGRPVSMAAEMITDAAKIEVPDFSASEWEFIGEKDWQEHPGTNLAYRVGHWRDYRHKTNGCLGREIEVLDAGVAMKCIWPSGKKDASIVAFLLTESYGWVRGEPGAYPRMREGRADGEIVTIMLIIKAEDGDDYWRVFDK